MITEEMRKRLVSILDYTRLLEHDDPQEVETFCHQAITPFGTVAAVCVYPQFVTLAKNVLANTPIKVATVANFPHGQDTPEAIFAVIKTAIAEGADEIDLVIPFHDYLIEKTPTTTELVATAKAICGDEILLKCILETGALQTTDKITTAAVDAILGGADFLKTSTGKNYPGASLEVTKILLQILKNHPEKQIGLKISGGIKTVAQAVAHIEQIQQIYAELPINSRYVRIGASSLLADILKA